MLILSLALIVGIMLLELMITGSALHPSVIYSGTWIFQLLGLIIFGSHFIEPTAEALLIVVAGVIFFTIGARFSSLMSSHTMIRVAAIRPRRITHNYWLYIICAVVVAISLHGQYTIFSGLQDGGDFAVGLVYARTLISVENEDIYGVYKYGSAIALAALLAIQILINRGKGDFFHKVLFAFFITTSLLMAVLSTGRGPVVFTFLLLGIVYVLTGDKRRRALRAFGVGASLLVVTFSVFFVMGSAMGKADDEVLGAIGNLVEYLFSSVPALSAYIDQNRIPIIGGDLGANTFRILFALAAAVGLADKPPNLVQEFISVPHLTNLYTTYLQYLKDFGWAGVIVVPSILGFLQTYLFERAKKNPLDDFALYLLCISYLPLLQAVFQETHFSLMSTWAQLIILGLIMTRTAGGNYMRAPQKTTLDVS